MVEHDRTRNDGAAGPATGPGRRTALVTGAGRGIGRATALRLARDGLDVALAGRDRAELDAVAEAARAAGARAAVVSMDVASEASVRAGVEAAAEALGAPLVVVNNAGVASAAKFGDLSREEWDRTFAVNVTGAFLVTRTCLPAMLAAGWGRVVSIGSTASLQAYPYTAHYTASKHALLGMTRALALEVAAKGVTANCVCPGYVDTDLTRETIERIVEKTGRTAAEARRTLEAASPQRRLMTPDEVAGAVSWLCRDEAHGVNGQAIVVNGG
jgi:NAD(P)-dependent dehydrogenase (short-subunit alcohol dehydrogenase family)